MVSVKQGRRGLREEGGLRGQASKGRGRLVVSVHRRERSMHNLKQSGSQSIGLFVQAVRLSDFIQSMFLEGGFDPMKHIEYAVFFWPSSSSSMLASHKKARGRRSTAMDGSAGRD
jgi:hypothetical protein